MKNLKIHLDTLSVRDEALLEDFLALKYRMTKEELLLENDFILQDPDLKKILNRSYYAQAKEYFNENLKNYARKENNATNPDIISEKYFEYLKRTKSQIMGAMNNPYDYNSYIENVSLLFEGIDLNQNPDIASIKEDLIVEYENELSKIKPYLIEYFNENYEELEDGGMPAFLAATQDMPDSDKEQIFQMAFNKMPIDDKMNMAINYLDMSDVQDVGSEVSNMADVIKDSRIDQGDSASAIANLIGEITDNPKEVKAILSNLSDDTLHLISHYVGGPAYQSYEGDESDGSDGEQESAIHEADTQRFSDEQSYEDSGSYSDDPNEVYLPDPFSTYDHMQDYKDDADADDDDDVDGVLHDQSYADNDSDSDFEDY